MPPSDLLDLARLETGGADADPAGVTPVADPDALDVGQPTAAGPSVRMADLFADPRTFAADLTAVRHGGRNLLENGRKDTTGDGFRQIPRRILPSLWRHLC
jgi:hypothetical protein